MLIWQRSKIVLSKQHRRLHGFLVSHALATHSLTRTRAHLLTRRLISVVIAHVACMQIRECRVSLIDRAMRRRSGRRWGLLLLLHAHTFVQRLIAGLSEMLQICVPQRCFWCFCAGAISRRKRARRKLTCQRVMSQISTDKFSVIIVCKLKLE